MKLTAGYATLIINTSLSWLAGSLPVLTSTSPLYEDVPIYLYRITQVCGTGMRTVETVNSFGSHH